MAQSSRLNYVAQRSPIGWFAVAMNDQDLICNVCLGDTLREVEEELQARHPSKILVTSQSDILRDASKRIAGYLEDPSPDINIHIVLDGTEMQQEVWRAIRRIPMGQTATYGDLASDLGAESSSRAVAQACGANPIAVLIPCHRVVKGDGSISGYQWGVERKRQLLERERKARTQISAGKPGSSAFARGQGDVHVVPMSVIRRPMPSELDEGKVALFVEEMKVRIRRRGRSRMALLIHKGGDMFTPVEIVKVKSRLKSDPTGPVHNFYFSLGGCHRYEATRRLGLPTIRARIIEAPASQLRVYLGAGSPF